MARLLGIDVGTSGTKAVLIDETGAVLAQGSAEYPISTPRPMWSEQDPEHWWEGVQSCLRQIGATDVDAVGLSGQMHGSVFLDEHDRVIRPAILWNDQRTAEECADIDRLVGAQRVREITGNPPVTGFQAPKILWLRKNEPEAFARVRSVLLPKDYIRFRLTGEKFTEVSDASGVGLFDVARRRWSEEMLAALDLDPSLFP
ncbi:MAG: FGGY family carbohydrate kinase, partial [Fimbriimonadales bacterium]